MRILVVSTRNIYPLDAGFKKRIHHVSTALKGLGEIDLLLTDIWEGKEDSPFHRVISFPMEKGDRIKGILKTYPFGMPLQVGYFFSQKAIQWLKGHGKEYDLIWFNHVRAFPYWQIVKEQLGIPTVLDFHDSIALHYLQSRENTSGLWKHIYRSEYPRLVNLEKHISRHSPSLVVSPVDSLFIKHIGGKKPYVVPMGVNEIAFKEPIALRRKPIITFIGKLDYLPNTDAILWFVKNVHRKLRKKVSYTLVIIGGHAPPSIQKLPEEYEDIELTGYVENPYPIMAAASANIAPVFIGAGIQNKILEGLAVGTPVVTTPLGARPIVKPLRKYLHISTEPKEWIEILTYLLKHPIDIETAHGMKTETEKYYSWSSIYTQIRKVAKKAYEEAKHH